MAELIHSREGIAVIDDLLDEDHLSALRLTLGKLRYERINRDEWLPVWRLDDGAPLQGPMQWLDAARDDNITPGLEQFVGALRGCLALPEVQSVVGTQEVNWNRLGFSPWIYPVGAALSPHLDGHQYTGAFSYFFHSDWRLRWGGLLQVLGEPHPEAHVSAFGDGDLPRGRTPDSGLGTWIIPRPNRIVFISDDVVHNISRVDQSAGDRLRLSISGFFDRCD